MFADEDQNNQTVKVCSKLEDKRVDSFQKDLPSHEFSNFKWKRTAAFIIRDVLKGN